MGPPDGRPSKHVTDVEIVRAILDSHRERLGVELLERTGDLEQDARRLLELDAVVLSHDGGDDPVFVFANEAAARLWKLPIDALVGMPSRLSAPPEHRGERAAMLADAASTGVLAGYSGERVAADGSRFVIEGATLWTVDGYPERPGQAVVFRSWRPSSEGAAVR